METSLSSQGTSFPGTDIEEIRSRWKALSDIREGLLHSLTSNPVTDPRKLMEEFVQGLQGSLQRLDFMEPEPDSIGLEDLDIYEKQLKKELCLTDSETMKISQEIEVTMEEISNASLHFDVELESLSYLLEHINSQDQIQDGLHQCPVDTSDDYKFNILELDQKINKNEYDLNILEGLDSSLRRFELIGHIEDVLSAVKVLETEGSYIKLSLRTPINVSDIALPGCEFGCLTEPSVSNHELLIEVVEGSTEVKSIEIFPADICLDQVIHFAKTSSLFASSRIESSLGRLVRKIQERIILCNLRLILVKDANKSRHSFEYSDRDETIIVHMLGGIDCFVQIPQGWPLSSSPLILISMKSSNAQSRTISLDFLGKIKDSANSLEDPTRCHLVRFADALEEILTRQMHVDLHSAT